MAAYWTVIIKNDSTADITIEDLGLPISVGDQITLSNHFSYDEITGSDDLRELVANTVIVVNDGTNDFDAYDGVRWITSQNIKDLEDNYYDIFDLQESGQSQIHWDNIINTPPFETGNTLGEAYNEGEAGAGRVIPAYNEPVKIDRGASTDASFEIVSKAEPTTNSVGGQIDNINGTLCMYDNTRSKWLSIARSTIAFGRFRTTRTQILGFYGAPFPSNNSGIRMPRNATIVSLSGQFDASGTGTFQIYRNDTPIVLASLSIVASVGLSDPNVNEDVNANDFLQCRMFTATTVEDPFIFIELAWRL